MKKVLCIASITFLLFSCSNENKESLKKTKENVILEKCEKFFISELNDPKSFEKINSVITDSVFKSKDLISDLDMFYSESDVLDGITTQSKRDSILTLQSEIVENPNLDYLTYYVIEINYRAKNLNAALIKQKSILYYSPKTPPNGKNIMVYSNE